MAGLGFFACTHTCKSKPFNPLGRQGGHHRLLWFVVIPLFVYFSVFCLDTQGTSTRCSLPTLRLDCQTPVPVLASAPVDGGDESSN